MFDAHQLQKLMYLYLFIEYRWVKNVQQCHYIYKALILKVCAHQGQQSNKAE